MKRDEKQGVRSGWHIYRMPVLLWLSAVTGLCLALISNGYAELLGWVGLGLPIALCLWKIATTPRPKPGHHRPGHQM